MEVYIPYKNKKFAGEHIPKLLKGYIKRFYNPKHAQKLDAYLKVKGVNISVLNIFNYAIDTVKVLSSGTGYTIVIDKNRIPLGSKYNIETLTKLINYGTVEIRGYKLLHEAFTFIRNNINRIAELYATKEERENTNVNRTIR